MSHNGLFITLEGIDGAGKSSHMEALAQAFRLQGRVVHTTREPGGTALAERLRLLVLHEPMDTLTEALLVFAARRDHLRQVIEPNLHSGDVVLCDRFTDSSFAYQGGGRGLDLQVLLALEAWVQGSLQPNLTLWFDVPAEVAAQRLEQARVPDKFESQSIAFFQRVSQAYAERMHTAPARWLRIDGNQAPGQVWLVVEQEMRRRGYLA